MNKIINITLKDKLHENDLDYFIQTVIKKNHMVKVIDRKSVNKLSDKPITHIQVITKFLAHENPLLWLKKYNFDKIVDYVEKGD